MSYRSLFVLLFFFFWPLYCLSFDLWLPLWYLQSFLTSVSHNYCVHQWVHVTKSLVFCGVFCRSLFVLLVCRSIYDFWLPLWYPLVIVLSVIPFMISDYLFGIFWSLYCLSFHLWFLITSLVSFGHCIVCHSIWLPLWYLLVIVLSVIPSDYLFGIFWSLYCLSFHFWFLITSLVSFGHCIVCRSIWLPLWYLLVIVLSVVPFMVSDYLFGIFNLFWPLYHIITVFTPPPTSQCLVGSCY